MAEEIKSKKKSNAQALSEIFDKSEIDIRSSLKTPLKEVHEYIMKAVKKNLLRLKLISDDTRDLHEYYPDLIPENGKVTKRTLFAHFGSSVWKIAVLGGSAHYLGATLAAQGMASVAPNFFSEDAYVGNAQGAGVVGATHEGGSKVLSKVHEGIRKVFGEWGGARGVFEKIDSRYKTDKATMRTLIDLFENFKLSHGLENTTPGPINDECTTRTKIADWIFGVSQLLRDGMETDEERNPLVQRNRNSFDRDGSEMDPLSAFISESRAQRRSTSSDTPDSDTPDSDGDSGSSFTTAQGETAPGDLV